MCEGTDLYESTLVATCNIVFCFSVQMELRTETQKTVDLIDTLEQQSQHKYHAEPPINMPYIPPNINLAQKSGYLLHRS